MIRKCLKNFEPVALAAALTLIALFAPDRIQAQTPGVEVTIPSSQQPVRGPGQFPNSPPDGRTTWSLPQGGATGWSHILLADINRDGRDDLCGLYGLSNGQHVYGCVLNHYDRTFSGNIIQAAAFNGDPKDSIHTTIRALDLDGSGSAHLCGRTMDGMRCQRFTGSSFQPSVRVLADFSDAASWDQEPYYSTIGFAKLGGVLTLCGRGIVGVMCRKKRSIPAGASQADAFETPVIYQLSFSDANGWNQSQYFRTLSYVDINRDGTTDICGRGIFGIWCALGSATSFGNAFLWSDEFADNDGFANERYYRSVRFGDISNDGLADVCARKSDGMYCGLNPGAPSSARRPLGIRVLAQSQMTDANGWGAPPDYLRSLMIVDFDGDGKADVCGLLAQSGGSPHILCAKSRSPSIPPNFAGDPFGMVKPVFDPLLIRTGSIAVTDKVVSGRLYTGSKVGFCWTS